MINAWYDFVDIKYLKKESVLFLYIAMDYIYTLCILL